MTRLPRWMHRAYARAFGYFWLPCSLCGRMYGGHEWDGRIGVFEVREHGVAGLGCCPLCPGYGESWPTVEFTEDRDA